MTHSSRNGCHLSSQIISFNQKILWRTLSITTSVSDEFRLKHRIRMRREAVAELAPLRVRGARGDLHLCHAEIVLRFDVGAIDLGDLDRTRKLFILRFEFDFDGLVAVSVDYVQNERAVVVPG